MMWSDEHLPLLSVDKDRDGDENHCASNESVSLVSVAVEVVYSTPPTFSSTILDVITSGPCADWMLDTCLPHTSTAIM